MRTLYTLDVPAHREKATAGSPSERAHDSGDRSGGGRLCAAGVPAVLAVICLLAGLAYRPDGAGLLAGVVAAASLYLLWRSE